MCKNLFFHQNSKSKRGGKKLVGGKKTLDLQSIDSQLSFAQKLAKWNLVILACRAFFRFLMIFCCTSQNDQISFFAIFATFWNFLLIFWESILSKSKVFYHPTSFLPPLFDFEFWWENGFLHNSKLTKLNFSKKGGKKLLIWKIWILSFILH